jgi:hypothetical protein
MILWGNTLKNKVFRCFLGQLRRISTTVKVQSYFVQYVNVQCTVLDIICSHVYKLGMANISSFSPNYDNTREAGPSLDSIRILQSLLFLRV